MANTTEDIRTDLRAAHTQLEYAKASCGHGAENADQLAAMASSEGWDGVAYGFSQVATELRDGAGALAGLEGMVSEANELVTGNTDQGATQPIGERLRQASGKLSEVQSHLAGVRGACSNLLSRIAGLAGESNLSVSDTMVWQATQEIVTDDIPLAVETLTRAKERVDEQMQKAANLGSA